MLHAHEQVMRIGSVSAMVNTTRGSSSHSIFIHKARKKERKKERKNYKNILKKECVYTKLNKSSVSQGWSQKGKI